MNFFKKITTETENPEKKNAVIMGRKTYFSIPEKFRPLANRINIVLSRTLSEAQEGVMLAKSFQEALNLARSKEMSEKVESIYVIGGSSVYQEALNYDGNCRVYLTRVLADFECDTFLPELNLEIFKQIERPEHVPEGLLTEQGIDFRFEVYDKTNPCESDMKMCTYVRDFYMCVAKCSNQGIAINNVLPWPTLRGDFEYYTSLTSRVEDPDKKVARIKGRKTWLASCEQEKGCPTAHNVVISSTSDWALDEPRIHKVCPNLDEALKYVSTPPISSSVETVWIMGGQTVYEDAIKHPSCKRLYVTEVDGYFDSDRFFPGIPESFELETLPEVDTTEHKENGIYFRYRVYGRKN
ncbi:hypothetical protein ScPMuIL_002635 [Solemya velum]